MEPYAIVDTAERVAVDRELQEAIAADKEVDIGSDGVKKGSMRVGWYGRIVKMKNRFEQMGYVDEKDYRLRKGVGRSTWYRMLRIAEDFQRLTPEAFLRMTAENAEHLARLSEDERYTGGMKVNDQFVKWIDLAALLNEEQFQKAILEAQAAAAAVPVAEMPVTLKMRVFEGQRPVILATIDEFQKDHGMKTPGEALEAICVEMRGRKTFTQFMQEALPRLRGAMKLTQDVEPESAIGALRDALEQHIMDLAAALEETGVQSRWGV